jgi:hypothetical protein
MKVAILALLVVGILARTYPMYKQCDSQWGSQQLGTSSQTICQAGCLMSSAAMGLSGTGHSYNPSTLNTWLKAHGGYVSGNLFVWGSINSIGLTFEGKVANSQIKAKLDAGKVVICNVHNGGHWVLAHGYSGDNILVNDPGYTTTSYTLSQIVDGQNGIYHAGNGEEKPSMFMTFKNAFLRREINFEADVGSILAQEEVHQA